MQRRRTYEIAVLALTTLLAAACNLGGDDDEDDADDDDDGDDDGSVDGGTCEDDPPDPPLGEVIPLKEAKLNIEHNATDLDTGFQGAIDGEGWGRLDVTGPGGGRVLTFEGRGTLRQLGLTELFFETVEPENADVPISEMLAKLPAGDYVIEGPAIENGELLGQTRGVARLTHAIPAGPVLVAPAEGAIVPTTGVVARWRRVTQTIDGGPVTIIAYQLIVEKDQPPHPHMIGKRNSLSMYLRPSVTSIAIPDGFLQPGSAYNWEVLAIEVSGNQTLSSGTFATR